MVTVVKVEDPSPGQRLVGTSRVEDRMKKTAWIALLLSIIVASSASAGGGALGVNGGMAKGAGDFADATRVGFQAGVFGEYAIHERFAIGVGVDYLKMNASDDYETALGKELGVGFVGSLDGVPVFTPMIVDDASFTILPVTVYGKWMPAMQGSVAPYVQAGGGLYVFMPDATIHVGSMESSGSETIRKPGFFGGAGVDFEVNPRIKIGVFGKFHDILTGGSSTLFVHAGVNASFGLGAS